MFGPNITGHLSSIPVWPETQDGQAFRIEKGGNARISGGSGAIIFGVVTLSAQKANAVYGDATTINPQSVSVMPCIHI